MDFEEVIMTLIVDGGDARTKAMQAIEAAEKKDFALAEQRLKESEEALMRAHQVQTSMIQEEINGKEKQLSLLMVHGQDHLMNAVTVRDMAVKMVKMYQILYRLQDEKKEREL